MKIGLVMTVKNEARLLRQNILYHRYLGVDEFFVYLDNTTDNGHETIKDLPYVNVQPSISAEKYQHMEGIEKLIEKHAEHHTARQGLNSVDAIEQGRQKAIDWVIALDADELICPDPDHAEKDQLKDFFKSIKPETDQVIFTTREAVQRQKKYNNVFAEEVLFKATPSFKSRWDRVNKFIYDPINDNTRKASYWYGQRMGKSAVRPSSGPKPKTVHKFQKREGGAMNTEHKGYVLHFHAYDFEDFVKKFQNFKNRPNTFLSGNSVEFKKLLWRDVVNTLGYSQEQLEEYFVKWVMFSPEEIKKAQKSRHFGFLSRKEAAFTEIQGPSQAFSAISQKAD